MSYFGYLLIIVLLTVIPQVLVKHTYRKYFDIKTMNGQTGEELVKRMLFENGIGDVSIGQIGGTLSDHYDSKRKIINLSMDNFNSSNVASIAVAAHETGHAIQHNKGYLFLKLRKSLGPVTIVASKVSWIVIYLGFLLYFAPFIYLGIILLGVMVLFDLVTLPVEINASIRARKYLISTGNFTNEEISGASKVLTAAAFTYVATTLAGILQIIRLISSTRRD